MEFVQSVLWLSGFQGKEGKYLKKRNEKNEEMKKLHCKRIFKVTRGLLTLLICSTIIVTGDVISEAIDFNGTQSSSYDLSNGERVRIEYHGGQPHYHDSRGSANLSDGSVHHSGGNLPKKSTRDIMNGKKGKSKADERARKKGEKWKKEWEKAEKNAKNSSKNFIKKNKNKISKAAKAGKVVVIIGGVVYVLWWILKIASGWGILIPV